MKTASRKAARLRVKVLQLEHAAGLGLPTYATPSSAGVDLVAAVPMGEPIRLKPGARALVPTGLVLELPVGHEGQVRPRSGLALKHGVTVLNSPGTIDADYRGEVQVVLVNLGDKPFEIVRGERIAQLVIAPVVQVSLAAVTKVSPTRRGIGGFGSTGTAAPKKPAKAAAAERPAAAAAAPAGRKKRTAPAPSRRPLKPRSPKRR